MKYYYVILIATLAALASLIATPNYMMTLGAWASIPLWLILSRKMAFRYFLPLFVIIQTAVSILGNFGVFPFPLPAMIIFYLIISSISILPYLLDRFTIEKLTPGLQSLVFPSAMVLIDYLFALGPSGTWGNIVYTQTSWLTLIQSVSIGGIWLIGFTIYWFGPVLLLISRFKFSNRAVLIFIVFLLFLNIYGLVRMNTAEHNQQGLHVAGIVANPLKIGEALLLASNGEKVSIPPDIAQSDPLLARLNLALLAFLSDPSDPSFHSVHSAMNNNSEELFARAGQYNGVDLISWSEGAFQVLKEDEERLISKASRFARSNQTTLFLPLAIFHTGKVRNGEPFLENKILIMSDEGRILDSYFKNVPVEGLEPSFPGDGTIPKYPVNGFQVSPGICYDADFPNLIAQTGRKNSEYLILPSSDWYAISKIHSRMAAVRAIENDLSLFRPTANGLTLAVTGRGEILMERSSFEGFTDAEIMLPPGSSESFYSKFPSMIPLFAGFILVLTLLSAVPKVRELLPGVSRGAGVSSANS